VITSRMGGPAHFIEALTDETSTDETLAEERTA
jgi:hypothetical protein